MPPPKLNQSLKNFFKMSFNLLSVIFNLRMQHACIPRLVDSFLNSVSDVRFRHEAAWLEVWQSWVLCGTISFMQDTLWRSPLSKHPLVSPEHARRCQVIPSNKCFAASNKERNTRICQLNRHKTLWFFCFATDLFCGARWKEPFQNRPFACCSRIARTVRYLLRISSWLSAAGLKTSWTLSVCQKKKQKEPKCNGLQPRSDGLHPSGKRSLKWSIAYSKRKIRCLECRGRHGLPKCRSAYWQFTSSYF